MMRNTGIAYTSSGMDKVYSEREIQALLGPLNLGQTEKYIGISMFTVCMLRDCRTHTPHTYNECNRDCSDNSCP